MHAILENAKKYPFPKDIKAPSGYSYNKTDGYWVSDRTGDALVYSGEISGLATKKADVETGEDQKGE